MVNMEDLWKIICLNHFEGEFIFCENWKNTYFINKNYKKTTIDKNYNNNKRKRDFYSGENSDYLENIKLNLDQDLSRFCGVESIPNFFYFFTKFTYAI